jgi:glycine/D-amino acid oxidase-like deaminating enzyme
MNRTFDVVICGAGIAGVSAAYSLSRAGIRSILLVDERPPLSFTSDRSTECYRNWWPDGEMLAMMNRSIDLMERLADATGNPFHLNRRGYLYVTGDEAKIPALIERSKRTALQGAGPLRIHESGSSGYRPAPPHGFHDQPAGADRLLGRDLIHKYYPYLTETSAAALHARRAGWLSAQQLGVTLFDAARSLGVRFESARVDAVVIDAGRVRGVRLGSGEHIDAPVFVNAAGPFLRGVGRMLGVDLPVHTELHMKAVIKDALGAVDRDAPLLIWDDPQDLLWEAQEKEALAADPQTRWLTGSFPAGVHTRPEGGADSQAILMLWEYKTRMSPPAWPPALDGEYPEIALRGLGAMIPRLREYFNRMPRPQVDGGYYTRTRENRPLVGPHGVDGAYLAGAVSGYGIMSACAVGELLSAHVTGGELPAYAGAFRLERYADPAYRTLLENWDDSGQL